VQLLRSAGVLDAVPLGIYIYPYYPLIPLSFYSYYPLLHIYVYIYTRYLCTGDQMIFENQGQEKPSNGRGVLGMLDVCICMDVCMYMYGWMYVYICIDVFMYGCI
jgi:hypothetical protein